MDVIFPLRDVAPGHYSSIKHHKIFDMCGVVFLKVDKSLIFMNIR